MSIKSADAAWKQRGKKGEFEKVISACEKVLEKKPQDYEALWRLARAYWWKADATEDTDVKTEAGAQGMEYGEQAVEADEDRVEGHFWHACCIGEYAQGISIVKALMKGLDGTFRRHAEASIELDEAFEGGGPHRALGRYYMKLPWPKRKLKKSLEHLREAVELGPKRAMNLWFLGETLAAMGDEEEAEEFLKKAVRLKSPDPDEKPDSPRYRKAAKEALDEL